ncbi:MAG: sodium-independent anion transporter [Saprospiraceae bacterium]|nr:sodium-independent anion transporter [Saprospiraceae bacterium]
MQLGKKVSEDAKLLIIDMKRVPYIDQSWLYSLESIILDLEQKKVQVYILHLQKQPEAMMRNISLILGVVEENTVFDDEELCAEAIKLFLKE